MIFFKIFVLIIYLLTLKMYYRQRKNVYMEQRTKYIDWFYVFYTTGLTFYIFDLTKLALILYFVAICFQIRACFVGRTYENFKKWEKTVKISKIEKTMILLSLKSSLDFDEYCFREEMEEIRQKIYGLKQ